MRVAYFDCGSGASGDMILGALVSSGLDFELLRDELGKLGVAGYSLSRREVTRGGIAGTQVIVELDEHDHAHRHLADIEKIIAQSSLKEPVKARSAEVFGRLARAEASVHNKPVEHVHFHEVGAVDSIVDIVGAVVGLDALDIERIYCSALHVGSGTVQCAHGTLPVPAPATAELLKGKPFYSTGVAGELLTPTGAAILTTLACDFGPMLPMTVNAIGYGAGTRELGIPNLLRVFVGRAGIEAGSRRVVQVAVLQAYAEDTDSRTCDHVLSRMFELGALDACISPVRMKGNRPGSEVTVICRADHAGKLAEALTGEPGLTRVRWRIESMLEAQEDPK